VGGLTCSLSRPKYRTKPNIWQLVVGLLAGLWRDVGSSNLCCIMTTEVVTTKALKGNDLLVVRT
jgi:hypothetical protein